jgi:hypothetical protein
LARVKHDIQLEYASNTLEFWQYSEANEELPFGNNLRLSLARIDNPDTAVTYFPDTTANGSTGYAKFSINPTVSSLLYNPADSMTDYNTPKYDHIWSLKSDSDVYMMGYCNLVKVA